MKTLTSALIALAFTATAFAGKAGWDENYDKALTKAAAEKKSVLLDFTGSDWCGWCMKLDSEVFNKSAFKSFAKNNLVLVELDFPHGKHLSKKLHEQNAGLEKKYGVSGFPTLVLLDSTGKEIKRWGGYSPTFFDDLKAALPASESAAKK
jgi:thioredoxin-related protein